MSLPSLQIDLRPHVTLTFDLLTSKVDHIMPLPHGSLLPICTKIGSFVFKISCLQVWWQTNGRMDERTNGRTDGRTSRKHYASCQSGLLVAQAVVFMPPQTAAPDALRFCLALRGFCPSRLPSRTTCFFRFTRILSGFRWNSREVIATKNRLNGYMFGEVGKGTR